MNHRNRLATVAAFAVLWAAPAFGINEGTYPYTIVDSACTDTNDTPAAPATPPDFQAGRLYVPTPQTSGTSDGYCDHDPYIETGPYAFDTVVGGWIYPPPGTDGIYVNAVASGTDGDQKWRISVQRRMDHNDTEDNVDSPADQTGDVLADFLVGCGADFSPSPLGENLTAALPLPFRFKADLRGTTTNLGLILSWSPAKCQ
jgi:hypothetical protein